MVDQNLVDELYDDKEHVVQISELILYIKQLVSAAPSGAKMWNSHILCMESIF